MNKPKNGKGKKVMNPNVDENDLIQNPAEDSEGIETANNYSGGGNKKVTDPFGKEIKRKGTFSLPLAQNFDEAMQLSKGSEDDLIFWYNHGRKLQARIQLNSSLDVDLGSKQLNDDYKSFENAMEQIGVTKDTPKEERDEIQAWVLKQKKFEGIRAKWSEIQQNGFGPVHLDFSEVELKKPSGKRGRPAAEETATA